jgi:hypothetical protein
MDIPVSNIPGGYRISLPMQRVQIEARRFSDDRRLQSTSAELTVLSLDPVAKGHMHRARLNLTSTTGKTDFARALARLDDSIKWLDIVEGVGNALLDAHRQGDPVVMIGGDRPASKGIGYTIWPMCPDASATIIYGDGGTGKSLIALLGAYLVQTGGVHCGLRTKQGNALYLDYETCEDTMHERLAAIAAGLDGPLPELAYRYCYHPLADDIDAIQEIILEHSINFIVVDSLGLACGGDPSDPEIAIRMMGALRELRCTSLLVDHVSKMDNGGKPTPFGSVYKPNLARSTWYAKLGQRDNTYQTRVALHHRKANFGPLRPAIGLELTFEGTEEKLDKLVFKRFDVLTSDDDDLLQDASCADRVAAVIAHGSKTIKAIAEATGLKEGSIGQAVRRQAWRFQKLPDSTWGLKAKDSAP